MPNPRRRKFSVQNDLGNRNNKNHQQISSTRFTSTTAEDLKTTSSVNSKQNINNSNIKPTPIKGRHQVDKGTDHKNTSTSDDVKESKTRVSEKRKTVDKASSARSSSIDSTVNNNEDSSDSKSDRTNESLNVLAKDLQSIRDVSSNRHERHLHRMKVRSPRRRIILSESQNKPDDLEKCEISTSSSNLIQEVENEIGSEDIAASTDAPAAIESSATAEELSIHSLNHMCRICHGGESLTTELGSLISACSCRGTVGRVHVKCLERWLTESGKSRCELCGMKYATRRVHRYGVPRAFVMWIRSQNTKQLMVDSLGIMLMSPLAVMAAWLSGRTLASLMMQDSQNTPWPLASTFVLSCMTLVCYYCLIVSAAARHALGWWIWYRSQYEVRLEMNN